jgi:hypothetical protein
MKAMEPHLPAIFKSNFNALNEKDDDIRRWSTVVENLVAVDFARDFKQMLEFQAQSRPSLEDLADKFRYLYNRLGLGHNTSYIKKQTVKKIL